DYTRVCRQRQKRARGEEKKAEGSQNQLGLDCLLLCGLLPSLVRLTISVNGEDGGRAGREFSGVLVTLHVARGGEQKVVSRDLVGIAAESEAYADANRAARPHSEVVRLDRRTHALGDHRCNFAVGP